MSTVRPEKTKNAPSTVSLEKVLPHPAASPFADNALLLPGDFYRTIVDTITDIVCFIDPEGRIRYINDAGQRKLGRLDIPVTGMPFAALLASTSIPLIDALMTKVRQGKTMKGSR
jgi:PAS domain-containing protein